MPGYAAAVDDAAISAEALTSWSATLVEHLGTPVDIADALDEPGTFSKRTEHEIVLLVDARTVPGSPGHVLAPGEAEAECLAEVRGVILDLEHLENLCSLAERHDVPLPETGSFQTLQCYVTKRCTTSMSLDSQSLDEHGCKPRVQATGAGHGCRPRVQATGASHGCKHGSSARPSREGPRRRQPTRLYVASSCSAMGRRVCTTTSVLRSTACSSVGPSAVYGGATARERSAAPPSWASRDPGNGLIPDHMYAQGPLRQVDARLEGPRGVRPCPTALTIRPWTMSAPSIEARPPSSGPSADI